MSDQEDEEVDNDATPTASQTKLDVHDVPETSVSAAKNSIQNSE